MSEDNVQYQDDPSDPSDASREAVRNVANLVREVPTVVKETKAGYKTTEFWLTLAVAFGSFTEIIPVPDKYDDVAGIAAIAVYVLSRGLAKKGVPTVEELKSA